MAEYTCEVCGETLLTREEYERHLTASHPGPRRGELEVGDWMMGQNEGVLSRRGRSETPAFRCSYCGEEFGDQEELIEHIDSSHQPDELTA